MTFELAVFTTIKKNKEQSSRNSSTNIYLVIWVQPLKLSVVILGFKA